MRNSVVSLAVRRAFSGFAVGLTVIAAHAAAINDTGVTTCSNGTATVTCSSVDATYPGQDATFGRDAAAAQGSLTKTGAGPVGFDFTKLGMDGQPVADNAVMGSAAGQHACTKDNTTGLVWDVLLGSGTGYSSFWYDPNSATNGGFAGGYINSTQSIAYKVNAANSASQCGGTGWRIPTVRELLSISNLSTGDRPPGYFSINTSAACAAPGRGLVWSSQTVRGSSTQAWAVSQGGHVLKGSKDAQSIGNTCGGTSAASIFTMIVR